MTARAFAPAHISGLFAIHDEASDPLRRGSRGAGWSIDRGATAQVTAAEPGGATLVRIDGAVTDARVTRRALEILAPGQPLDVELRLDLPVGQGFGMSAAGTLATCLAATSELGIEPERALEAAHQAEVESGTGLGDAIGSWNGGGELRLKPGVPPHGWAMRVPIPEGTRFLFAVLGDPIATKSVIRDDTWRSRTRALGDAAVDRILAAGRDTAWATLLSESNAFSRGLGLMPAAMPALGERLAAETAWGQSMLGSTMWMAGTADQLATARSAIQGADGIRGLIEAAPDESGARLVR